MEIKKILNNNVAISQNEQGDEVIVVGCGIAFKKKIGETLDKNLIEKIFISTDRETKKKFQALLDEVPIEYIRITDKIIKYTENLFQRELNDVVYISIADHIFRSVERFVNSGELINGLLWDIKRLYRDEFQVGLYALDLIRQELKISMPEDEAAFIATHIINAKLKESIPNIIDITKLINEVLNIVRYNLQLDPNEECFPYYRFINHLKFLGQKIVNNKTGVDSGGQDDVYLLVVEKYPKEHQCVEKIADFIERKYKYILLTDDKLFLTLHIVKLKNENNEKCLTN